MAKILQEILTVGYKPLTEEEQHRLAAEWRAVGAAIAWATKDRDSSHCDEPIIVNLASR